MPSSHLFLLAYWFLKQRLRALGFPNPCFNLPEITLCKPFIYHSIITWFPTSSFTRTSWKQHYSSHSFSCLNDRFQVELCLASAWFGGSGGELRWMRNLWSVWAISLGKAAVLITDSSCHWYVRSEPVLITAVVKRGTFTVITWLWCEYCSVRGGLPHTW